MHNATWGDGKVVYPRKYIPEMEGERSSTMDPRQPYAYSFPSALMSVDPCLIHSRRGEKHPMVRGFLSLLYDGAFKSSISSAIIEEIENLRQAGLAWIAYYYFDFKDISKRDLRGLLVSLVFQLGGCSGLFWDVLHKLFTTCRDGSQQPSEAALAKCLKNMLEIPCQIPIFVVLDALDECSSTTGTPSARENVLDFVEDLLRSNHPNLFMCITSRPEQDIHAALNALTSPSSRVSLQEESGQREDINNYIRSFVRSDKAMRRWREEDKELVINTLSERAFGM